MAVQAEITSSRKIIPVTLEKSTSDNDLIRSYLRDIGRVPLLSNDQEITLGRHVQELMALENLEKDWQSTHGQKPNLDELASAAGLTVGALKKKVSLR